MVEEEYNSIEIPNIDSMDEIDFIENKNDDLLLIQNGFKFGTDPLARGVRRYNTTPEFEEPIFVNDEVFKDSLSSIFSTGRLKDITYETPWLGKNLEHIKLKIDIEEVEETTEINISIIIKDFLEYASEFPVNEVLDGKPEYMLSLNGHYYNTLENEIREIVGKEINYNLITFMLDDYEEENDIARFSKTINVCSYR